MTSSSQASHLCRWSITDARAMGYNINMLRVYSMIPSSTASSLVATYIVTHPSLTPYRKPPRAGTIRYIACQLRADWQATRGLGAHLHARASVWALASDASVHEGFRLLLMEYPTTSCIFPHAAKGVHNVIFCKLKPGDLLSSKCSALSPDRSVPGYASCQFSRCDSNLLTLRSTISYGVLSARSVEYASCQL